MIFRSGKDGFTAFSLNFIVMCVTEHRAAGPARTGRQWLLRCGQVLCVALAAAACSVLAFLHKVGLGRLWMPDTGRLGSGANWPCCLLILPGNGCKVKVNSYLLARAPLATQVHQPVLAG